MILTARTKRDRHLLLIAKMQERKRRKTTMIAAHDPVAAARFLREDMEEEKLAPRLSVAPPPMGVGLMTSEQQRSFTPQLFRS